MRARWSCYTRHRSAAQPSRQPKLRGSARASLAPLTTSCWSAHEMSKGRRARLKRHVGVLRC
eukprot:scaffold6413_cov334-Pinguiococcus_pyrenoidosus.AAC.2